MQDEPQTSVPIEEFKVGNTIRIMWAGGSIMSDWIVTRVGRINYAVNKFSGACDTRPQFNERIVRNDGYVIAVCTEDEIRALSE